MPRTHSLAWSELKIGAIAIFSVVMATGLIFLLSGEGGFFWQRYTVKAVFPDVAGLKPGAPVRVAGVEVGSVNDVVLSGDRVEVVMDVSQDMQPRITDTSVATIGSVSLLGEGAIDITSSSRGTPVPEFGYVPTGVAPGSIASVAAQATEGIAETTKLLQDIRAGRGTLGKLATDDTLYRELNAFVSAAEEVTRGIAQGRGTLGRLATDPAAAKSIEGALANLEAVTAKIRAGEGSLGRLVTDDSFGKSVASATANLDAITGRLSRGEGTAGKLMTDAELYNRLNSMADRLDKVTASLQQGEGTAGQLLHDRQLYENMNGAVGEVRKLVEDIRADPRKYLNVRVSIF